MKRLTLLFLILFFIGSTSFAQKIAGFGGELSILSIKPNFRMWISKATGFEIFGGLASELEDFQPNDLDAGFKFLHTIMYCRTDRTYIGIMGKWKWVDINYSYRKTNLPVPGLLIGKEWYSKRIHRKGFAIEVGYQFGTKTYEVTDPNGMNTRNTTFNEFPLILNFRYSFYTKK